MAHKCSECGDVVPTDDEPPLECLNCGNDEWEKTDEEPEFTGVAESDD